MYSQKWCSFPISNVIIDNQLCYCYYIINYQFSVPDKSLVQKCLNRCQNGLPSYYILSMLLDQTTLSIYYIAKVARLVTLLYKQWPPLTHSHTLTYSNSDPRPITHDPWSRNNNTLIAPCLILYRMSIVFPNPRVNAQAHQIFNSFGKGMGK